jgi:glycosyltransferase involved in cell wall biosynthesis
LERLPLCRNAYRPPPRNQSRPQNFHIRSPCPVKGRVGEGFNILFIGSLSSHKRVDLLINSFSLLLKSKALTIQRSKALNLIIAGQKTLFYPQIKKTLDNLDFQTKSKIKFIYNFPQNKLANLIDNCTFLVLPSIQESFGLVIIEAWARGKPVIVSNIPSLSELVKHSHGGLIFKPDNLDDLQTKIKKLINSPALCYQYGQNGLKYVKTNYTWEKVSQKISQKIRLS